MQEFVDRIGLQFIAIEELFGLSYSKNFRVTGHMQNSEQSFILKVVDYGPDATLCLADPLVSQREKFFCKSDFPDWISPFIKIPKIVWMDQLEDKTYIWMKDRKYDFQRKWEPSHLLLASQGCAELHAVYLREHERINGFPWLNREPYRLYEAHLQQAKDNTAKLAQRPELFPELDQQCVRKLQTCLEAYEWAIAELRRLPMTLTHRDFHPGNIGFRAGKGLTLIDWANVGISPLGSDIGVLIHLHSTFGSIRGCRKSASHEI